MIIMIERLKNKSAIMLVTLGIGLLLAINIVNVLIKEFFFSGFIKNSILIVFAWALMVIVILLTLQFLGSSITDLQLLPMEKSN